MRSQEDAEGKCDFFILGIIATLLVLGLFGLAVATLGLVPTNADATPPRLERRVAVSALDASMGRHAPRVSSPIPPTDENLIDGMKVYTMNCSMCHGTLDNQPSPLERSFYPPAPQLILDPLDDPESRIYYAVRSGVRYTGMPAWNEALSDQDIWKVTAFLARRQTRPPGVRDYWKQSFGAGPPAAGSEKDKDKR